MKTVKKKTQKFTEEGEKKLLLCGCLLNVKGEIIAVRLLWLKKKEEEEEKTYAIMLNSKENNMVSGNLIKICIYTKNNTRGNFL